ncbi:DUF58 domain-containing protein [Nocardioides marmoribigeumensis]|uniref:Uncharacterized protein (DUF58 family) n=1 Tax=Nocardioides marmoribigeumensis TaxID=433649 RepID=A0ABU2BX19_9ACTN|nr:DUF58 domain-containing protein [Nocardioides marmoribigeumensis]MDR7362944.1 uncharacterized protein (DUF58 family) [Nocardioides marmoribigeumensis]
MHLTGRTPLLVLCGLAAVVVRPTLGTAWAWLLVVVLLVGLDLLLAPSPRRLEVVRAVVPPAREGARSETTLTVRNPGPRGVRGQLRDAWQPTAGAEANRHRLRLPAGEQARLTTPLRPTRRGRLRADKVTVRSRGPLGLACRQVSREVPGELRVAPPFESRKHLPSRLAVLREMDGRTAVRTRGQGTEFDSLREYVRGDDWRSIDWRATARSRTTVVRTWQPERDRRVVLVLDTSRTSAARVADVPRLDAAMEAVQLLATLAARAGDVVDVVAGDVALRLQLSSGHRHGVLPDLQAALGDLEPVFVEADWRLLAGAVQGLTSQRSLVVVLTSLDAAAGEHGLLPHLPVLARRHEVLVAATVDPSEADEPPQLVTEAYAAAGRAGGRERRRRAAAALALTGVEVLETSPDRLPVGVADHYLALKAAGRL